MGYLERICEPSETVARVTPFLSEFGVTRVARQTDLDFLGLPCFAAIRPNALNLSTSQGKGLSDNDARASAVMEALEYAVAEAPAVESFTASAADLDAGGTAYHCPDRYLPADTPLDRNSPIRWVWGRGLVTHRATAVPYDLISLSGKAPDLPGICQTTNGLASGNTEDEAVFHALCELIERDGYTCWMLRPLPARLGTALEPARLLDGDVVRLHARMIDAGLKVAVYDQTTDIGVPVVMALTASLSGYGRKFELAAGYGAHPSVARAAIRAFTEAAQTRVTSIVAARDDITSGDFDDDVDPDLEALLRPTAYQPVVQGEAPSRNAQASVRWLAKRLTDARLSEPVVVRLSADRLPFSVVRVLSADLEDAEANLNWRPGRRAMKVLEA